MKNAVILIGLLGVGLLAAQSATYYVTTNGTGNGTSWDSSLNSIQDAITLCVSGDIVLVSNGVYETGGVPVSSRALTNRVAINKSGVTVMSANNDPANTIIKGAYDDVSGTTGPAAVRCVYMAANTTLIGFTLTNGATLASGHADDGYGGGIFALTDATISNCVITGSFMRYGGGARGGILHNCKLIGNTGGEYGGGASKSVLHNCCLSDNVAYGGAGAYQSTLYDCWIVNNRTTEGTARGGGVNESTLYNCILTNNHCLGSYNGGAARISTLYNCILINNTSLNYGGGTSGGTQYNCTFIGNKALNHHGGGAYQSILYNCTLTGNEAKRYGGGMYNSSAFNSIVWDNLAPSASETNKNYDPLALFSYSCTYPLPAGEGNIALDPRFVVAGSGYGTSHIAGNYNLRGQSPCVDKGVSYSWMTDPEDVRCKDLDGRDRIIYGVVDLGAYEFYAPAGSVFSFR